jgi:hypothetical protein
MAGQASQRSHAFDFADLLQSEPQERRPRIELNISFSGSGTIGESAAI